MEHFGVTVREGTYGFKLSREKYAIINNKNSLGKFDSLKNAYADEEANYYTEEWCDSYRKLCLENFDLNMKFFQSLHHDEFEEEIQRFLKKNKKFIEVHDLKQYSGVGGYYLMILDQYCQVYVGTTDNIKRRIQQHWTKIKSFDRLLFPMYAVNKSILSIDSFRALDTTRIFAYKTSNLYNLEDRYIKTFSSKFLSNRISGGKLEDGLLGIAEIKSRDLI